MIIIHNTTARVITLNFFDKDTKKYVKLTMIPLDNKVKMSKEALGKYLNTNEIAKGYFKDGDLDFVEPKEKKKRI